MLFSSVFVPSRVWVLVLFASLIAFSQVILYEGRAGQRDAGKVINISGRQRMLSQRILAFSCIDAETNIHGEVTSELISASNELYGNHTLLLYGNEEYEFPLPDETLEAELLGLQSAVEEISDLVNGIVEGRKNNFYELKTVVDFYLPRMDLAVSGLVDRTKIKADNQNIVNIVSDFLILFLGVIMYRNYRVKRNQKKRNKKSKK